MQQIPQMQQMPQMQQIPQMQQMQQMQQYDYNYQYEEEDPFYKKPIFWILLIILIGGIIGAIYYYYYYYKKESTQQKSTEQKSTSTPQIEESQKQKMEDIQQEEESSTPPPIETQEDPNAIYLKSPDVKIEIKNMESDNKVYKLEVDRSNLYIRENNNIIWNLKNINRELGIEKAAWIDKECPCKLFLFQNGNLVLSGSSAYDLENRYQTLNENDYDIWSIINNIEFTPTKKTEMPLKLKLENNGDLTLYNNKNKKIWILNKNVKGVPKILSKPPTTNPLTTPFILSSNNGNCMTFSPQGNGIFGQLPTMIINGQCGFNQENQMFEYDHVKRLIKKTSTNLCLDDGGVTGINNEKKPLTLKQCDISNYNQRFEYRLIDENTNLGAFISLYKDDKDMCIYYNDQKKYYNLDICDLNNKNDMFFTLSKDYNSFKAKTVPAAIPLPLYSPDGKFILVLQDDGNLVISPILQNNITRGSPIWNAAATTGYNKKVGGPYYLFLANGELSIRNPFEDGVKIWSNIDEVGGKIRTDSRGPYKLSLTNEGILYVYDGSDKVFWSSTKPTIYTNKNFGGDKMELKYFGDYTKNNLQGTPEGDALLYVMDEITSIQIPKGYKVIIYKNENFLGDKLELTSSSLNIGGDFNDEGGSIKVQPA